MSGRRWLSRPSALCFIWQPQRKEKCILKLSFEGGKKNLFRQITARMKSTFSSWCASVGRCLNRISIKQDSFIISQIQIEVNIGLRFNLKLTYYIYFPDLFPSNFTPELSCFLNNLFWFKIILWWNRKKKTKTCNYLSDSPSQMMSCQL